MSKRIDFLRHIVNPITAEYINEDFGEHLRKTVGDDEYKYDFSSEEELLIYLRTSFQEYWKKFEREYGEKVNVMFLKILECVANKYSGKISWIAKQIIKEKTRSKILLKILDAYSSFPIEACKIMVFPVKEKTALSGIKINIIDNRPSFVYKSDKNGLAKLELPFGKYKFKVSKDGYHEWTDVIEVRKVKIEKEIELKRSRFKYLKIRVVTRTQLPFWEKKPVIGAKVEILDLKGNVISKAVTRQNGIAYISSTLNEHFKAEKDYIIRIYPTKETVNLNDIIGKTCRSSIKNSTETKPYEVRGKPPEIEVCLPPTKLSGDIPYKNVKELIKLRPEEFEQATIRLLRCIGYRNPEKPKKDIGIDIVCENERGELVAVQCKRWKNRVDRTVIHNFLGAMSEGYHGKSFRKGIIVTTSHITDGAKEAIRKYKRKGKIIEVIDKNLLELLLNKLRNKRS